MALINSAIPAHQAVVNLSEMQRQGLDQAAVAAFNNEFNNEISSLGAFVSNNSQFLQATLIANLVADLRSRCASALANGVDVGQYLVALQALGYGLYP